MHAHTHTQTEVNYWPQPTGNGFDSHLPYVFVLAALSNLLIERMLISDKLTEISEYVLVLIFFVF